MELLETNFAEKSFGLGQCCNLVFELTRFAFCLLLAGAVGCAPKPTWVVDTSPAAGGTPDPNDPSPWIVYRNAGFQHAVLYKSDPSLLLGDSAACQRNLSRSAEYRHGERPKAAAHVVYVEPKGLNSSATIWVHYGSTSRWAVVDAREGQSWKPMVESFVREVMKEPEAARELGTGRDCSWSYGNSTIRLKALGEVDLPPHWYGLLEISGAPPQVDDRDFVLAGHKGSLEIRELTPDSLRKDDMFARQNFQLPVITDGVTRLGSGSPTSPVAYLVRKGALVIALVASASPDTFFILQTKLLADFFAKKLKL